MAIVCRCRRCGDWRHMHSHGVSAFTVRRRCGDRDSRCRLTCSVLASHATAVGARSVWSAPASLRTAVVAAALLVIAAATPGVARAEASLVATAAPLGQQVVPTGKENGGNSGTSTPEGEIEALHQLYAATAGPRWKASGGWNHGDPCGTTCSNAEPSAPAWFGIICSCVMDMGKNVSHVAELDLSDNLLHGSVPASITQLEQLQVLSLADNVLDGAWLDLIVELKQLILIKLSTVGLRGTIPDSIGSLAGLSRLSVSGNALSGTIPASICQLTQLTLLDLSANSMEGSIPEDIGQLEQLQVLYLNYNSIEGTVPQSARNLKKLRYLFLNDNLLSGLPDWIGDLDQLTYVDVSANQLQGTLPDSIGRLMFLFELILRSNQLIGTIPAEIGALTQLSILDLGKNMLRGSIPSSIGNLSQVNEVDLSENQLQGTMPSSIGGMRELTTLDLHSNALEGSIPNSIGELTSLSALYLNLNKLEGSIPDSIGRLTGIADLYLNDNRLTGTIPAAIGSLARLSFLDMSSNSLSGPLPATIWALSLLVHLDISRNRLESPFPRDLSGMSLLSSLSLRHNNFTSLPTLCAKDFPPVLSSLDLHNNSLNMLMQDASNCTLVTTTLNSLDVSSNRFDGDYTNQLFLAASLRVSVLTAADNPGLRSRITAFTQWTDSLISLDLSGTAVSGDFQATDSSFDLSLPSFLTQLVLTDCTGITGSLPKDSTSLVYADLRGTSVSAKGQGLPVYLTAGIPQRIANGSATCDVAQPAQGAGPIVLMDDSYDDYARCRCIAGFAGRGVSCLPCAPGHWSDDNEASCTPCDAGTYQPADSGRAGRMSCRTCPYGNFSLPGSTSCFACPDHGVTCNAGTVTLQPGYWWSGGLRLESSLSDDLFHCVGGTEACPGTPAGAAEGDLAPCGRGRMPTSPLCGVCSDGYVHTGVGTCEACPSALVTTLTVAVVGLLTTVCLLVWLYRRGAERHKAARPLRDVAGSSHSDMAQYEHSENEFGALRTLVTFLQLTALNAELKQRYSLLLHRVLSTSGAVGGNSLAHLLTTPLQCIVSNVQYTTIVFASAALPVLCVVFVAVWALMARVTCRSRFNVLPYWHDVALGSTALFFLLYSRTTRVALAAFKMYSRPISNGTVSHDYLEADLRVSASSSEFASMQIVAACILVVYTVAAPALAFWRLHVHYSHPRHLDQLSEGSGMATELLQPDFDTDADRKGSIAVPSSLSLLVRGYRAPVWWWELTIVGRKVAFAALVVFVDAAGVQSALAGMLLACLLVLQLQQQPFEDPRLNRAEALSLFTLLVTRLGTAMFPYDSDADSITTSDAVAMGALLLLNGATVAVLVRLSFANRRCQHSAGRCSRAVMCQCIGDRRRLRRMTDSGSFASSREDRVESTVGLTDLRS